MAVADFDGDGRLDLAMNNNNNVPALYWNRIDNGSRYLGIELVGRTGNTDAVGARVSLTFDQPGGSRKTSTRWVEAGSGYASQSSHVLHFGLGQEPTLETLEIVWPSGHVDRLDADLLGLDRTLHIAEGGEVLAVRSAVHGTPPASPTSDAGHDLTADLGSDLAAGTRRDRDRQRTREG